MNLTKELLNLTEPEQLEELADMKLKDKPADVDAVKGSNRQKAIKRAIGMLHAKRAMNEGKKAADHASAWGAEDQAEGFNRWMKELLAIDPKVEIEQTSKTQWEAYSKTVKNKNGRNRIGTYTFKWGGDIDVMPAEGADYEARVQKYEDEGLSRSDAQAAVDAEDLPKKKLKENVPFGMANTVQDIVVPTEFKASRATYKLGFEHGFDRVRNTPVKPEQKDAYDAGYKAGKAAYAKTLKEATLKELASLQEAAQAKLTPAQAEEELLKVKGVTSVELEDQHPGTYVHFKFRGNDFSLRFTKKDATLFVQGYKSSIEMQDGVESITEVMNLVKAVDKKWFKEYDEGLQEGKLAEASALNDVTIAGMSDRRTADLLSVGDPVEITGKVQFNGKTGEIDAFGKDKKFVVVKLYNGGTHSFHSSDVQEIEDEEEEHTDELHRFYVAFYDEDLEHSWIGVVSKEGGGKWHEKQYKGKPEYRWGQSYMSYLTPDDIMSHIHKDYRRNVEIQGPFENAKEAEEHVVQNWGKLEESVMEAQEYKVGDKVLTKVGGKWLPATITKPAHAKTGNYGVRVKHAGKTIDTVSSLEQLKLEEEFSNMEAQEYKTLSEAKPARKGTARWEYEQSLKKQDRDPETIKRIEKLGDKDHMVGNAKVIHHDQPAHPTKSGYVYDPELSDEITAGFTNDDGEQTYVKRAKLPDGHPCKSVKEEFSNATTKDRKPNKAAVKKIDGELVAKKVVRNKDAKQNVDDAILGKKDDFKFEDPTLKGVYKAKFLADPVTPAREPVVTEETYTDFEDWKAAIRNSHPGKRFKFNGRMEGGKTTISAEVQGEDRCYGVWDKQEETGTVLKEGKPVPTTKSMVVMRSLNRLGATAITCPKCKSDDVKTYTDGEKECNQCHKTWDVKGMKE